MHEPGFRCRRPIPCARSWHRSRRRCGSGPVVRFAQPRLIDREQGAFQLPAAIGEALQQAGPILVLARAGASESRAVLFLVRQVASAARSSADCGVWKRGWPATPGGEGPTAAAFGRARRRRNQRWRSSSGVGKSAIGLRRWSARGGVVPRRTDGRWLNRRRGRRRGGGRIPFDLLQPLRRRRFSFSPLMKAREHGWSCSSSMQVRSR